MSLEAFVWATIHAPDVPPHCLGVLQGLANHADAFGRDAFPSVEHLGYYARKGDRAVQKDLRELEERGLIRPGDQRAAFRIPKRYRPMVYDLALERTRPAYVPKRLQEGEPVEEQSGWLDGAVDNYTAESADDGTRGERYDTSDAGGVNSSTARGEPQFAGGVAHGSPEPPPQPAPEPAQSAQGGYATHVGRGFPQARPLQDQPEEPPLPPLTPLAEAPLPRCPAHRATLNPPNCHACRVAREANEAWNDTERELVRQRDAAERERIKREKADAAALQAACRLCDVSGRLPSGLACLHDARANPSPERGGFAEFQALRRKGIAKSHHGPDGYAPPGQSGAAG